MVAWILFTGLFFFIVGWCIGIKSGANYEHDRLTDFYLKQASEKGFEIKEYKSFKEKVADKMAEKEIKN